MRSLPTFLHYPGVLVLSALVALSACENPLADKAPTRNDVVSRGWLYGDLEKAKPEPKSVQPVYCYRTIGVGDCFDQPLEGSEERLVGFDGPAPVSRPIPLKR